jgi:hypothetical protein
LRILYCDLRLAICGNQHGDRRVEIVELGDGGRE